MNAKPHRVLHVLAYFMFAPDEELDREGLFLKFGIQQGSATAMLRSSVRSGLLSKVCGDRGRVLYTSGPTLRQIVTRKIHEDG